MVPFLNKIDWIKDKDWFWIENLNLRGADLSDCDLSNAWLFSADLTNANLSNCNILGANFDFANFNSVNFDGVLDKSQSSFINLILPQQVDKYISSYYRGKKLPFDSIDLDNLLFEASEGSKIITVSVLLKMFEFSNRVETWKPINFLKFLTKKGE